jgi:hypothetical protein
MDETVIEADAVATTVRLMMATRATWTGIVKNLLSTLIEIAGEAANAKTWPTNPKALSSRLRRAAPNLRRVGISIVFGQRQARERPITIMADKSRIRPSQSSSSSLDEEIRDFRDDGRPVDDGATVTQKGATVIQKSPRSAAGDGCDDDDGVSPPFSGSGSDDPLFEWVEDRG